VNKQKVIGLFEWQLKTVVLAGTQTTYKIDCTSTQAIRTEWIYWTETNKFVRVRNLYTDFLPHFAPIRQEVNAECIAAFINIAKETGWSSGKFTFLPNSVYAQSPYIEYVNKTSIILLVFMSDSLFYNVNVTIGLSKHLQIHRNHRSL